MPPHAKRKNSFCFGKSASSATFNYCNSSYPSFVTAFTGYYACRQKKELVQRDGTKKAN